MSGKSQGILKEKKLGQRVGTLEEVSGHLLENAWREWPGILYADVSLPPS